MVLEGLGTSSVGVSLGSQRQVRVRELVGSWHFLGVSDVWVPENLGSGERGFVGPHMSIYRTEPLLAYSRCWTWPQTASSRGW